ncbi:hypothetical protein CEP54_001225 [Fusarium duplospermum]|uniref:Uncharacterized protein n=1 Tax=Fusarium duplospermum TaxID=1325734 RepID=A0A428R203_9HYPO|nr:hypothetical protein CEP54_001225 [Fusarium duplospermum]
MHHAYDHVSQFEIVEDLKVPRNLPVRVHVRFRPTVTGPTLQQPAYTIKTIVRLDGAAMLYPALSSHLHAGSARAQHARRTET